MNLKNRSTMMVVVMMMSAVLALATGCAKNEPLAHNQLPESWYTLPQAQVGAEERDVGDELEEAPEALGRSVDRLYAAESDALESAELGTRPMMDVFALGNKHSWNLGAMITGLSVSLKGVIGPLIMKGTPSVITHWRKQYPAAPQALTDQLPTADLVVTSETTRSDVAAQLEPAIRAVMATGQVHDEKALRSNLIAKGEEFLAVAMALDATPTGKWWVSRYRVDVSVDASGKVTPAVTAGVDARFRFEWHRMMRKPRAPVHALAMGDKFSQSIQQFAIAMVQDMEAVSEEDEELAKLGFKAAGMRVGVGFSAERNIGLVKAASSVIGQIHLSTDTKKPVIHPKPTPKPILSSGEQVQLDVDRAKFRKGLKKAMKISRFFARRAGGAGGNGKWKVHELKTGFDLSLSGKVGLATVSGLGTVEVAFFNQNF